MILKSQTSRTSGYKDISIGHVYGVQDGQGIDLPVSPSWLGKSACGSSNVNMIKNPPTPEQSEVCSGCPVRTECLEELVEFFPKEIVGTWAGLTNNDWQYLRKRLKDES